MNGVQQMREKLEFNKEVEHDIERLWGEKLIGGDL